jgi:hypothetical protein
VDNFIKSTTTFEEVDTIVTCAIIGAGLKNDGMQDVSGTVWDGLNNGEKLANKGFDGLWAPEAKATLSEMQDTFRAQRANRRT